MVWVEWDSVDSSGCCCCSCCCYCCYLNICCCCCWYWYINIIGLSERVRECRLLWGRETIRGSLPARQFSCTALHNVLYNVYDIHCTPYNIRCTLPIEPHCMYVCNIHCTLYNGLFTELCHLGPFLVLFKRNNKKMNVYGPFKILDKQNPIY